MEEVPSAETAAASPHAIGASAGVASHAPQTPLVSSIRHVPTAGDVFDKSDLPRMRVFHIYGVFSAFGAVGLSLLLGGDRFARGLYWAGSLLLALCNICLIWLSNDEARWKPTPVGVLWVLSTIGILPALYYYGPFSAAVQVLSLGTVFIALGRSQWTSLAVAGVAIGGHSFLAIGILTGSIEDVGVFPVLTAHRQQLIVGEALIVAFLVSGYALGRWARHTSAQARAELARAMQLIGDQQQALAEVKDDAARAKRIEHGRWSGQQMGSYRLGLVLGRGAMGEVYEAERLDGTPAAVKLLSARSDGSLALVERFHREMEVAAKLESPHIVRVFDLSPPDAPVPYIAMERLHGIDLATRLRSESRIPSDELTVMLDQVARGLEVARLAGVVHRDLKPHNLFFHDRLTWKILDFGVSKLLGSEGTLTGEGIVGTPHYMAPEQASGGQVTHLADVYALGTIAYRCLTGRTPFRGKDLSELVYQVVHAAPPRPGLLGRVSSELEDVLAMAMAKDPRRRFPSAVAFARAFAQARRGGSALAPPPGAWT
jgi:eukaryotic-like serine/threonine-protein kinase